MAFADAEKLGFDCTIQRMKDYKSDIFYVYDCIEGHFRTLGPPLFEDSALYLISRGVRVWKVRPCSKDGQFLQEDAEENVLKDYWWFKSYEGERDKRERLLRSDLLDESDREYLSEHFTTILHDIIVPGNKSCTLDLPPTHKRLTFASLVPKVLPRVAGSKRANTSPMSAQPIDTVAAVGPSRHEIEATPRHHRRTVQKEYCAPMFQLQGSNKPGLADVLQTFSEFALGAH